MKTAIFLLAPLLCAFQAADPMAAYELPAGLSVHLWADSPQLFNPAAIDVDARGRVWVAEAVNYRQWDGRNPGRRHADGDRIVVLEDTDGDGACDGSRVFVQDPDLVSPLGIAVVGDEVYVSCSPDLFVYRDTDGDGKADERRTLLTGFGGRDHDHGLHSVVFGPDGRLYAAAGNAGPHLVRASDGWSLRSGSLYTGGGEVPADNKPGLVSDDGRAWTGGLILRFEPDGSRLEVLAHNFRNNYEVTLDSWGNLFQSDNDDDGNQGCRTLWCLEGGDHGYFSADGTRYWTADRRPDQTTASAHWHQDDPGVVPAGCINGAGGPTGVCVYEGELLERWIGGTVLNADAGARVVYAHRPRADGAGFQLQPGELIRPRADDTSQEASWFRPSDVAVAPDGSVFVADWVDPGVGGHAAGDAEARGRILRIVPAHELVPAVEVDLTTPRGALAALASPAVHVREQGRRALVAQGAASALELWERDLAPNLRARLLWVLVALGQEQAVESRAAVDPGLRVGLVRSLTQARGGRLSVEHLKASGWSRDADAAVRRELALQLRDRPLAESLEPLLELAERYDGQDRWYLEALGLAARGHEEELYAELVARFGDTPRNWDARFEGLAWRLHPRAAIPAFTARALDTTLAPDARRRAIDALAFSPSRAAGESILTVAQAGPEDLRAYAEWWVRHRDENDWRAFGLLDQAGRTGFEEAALTWESGLLREGLVDVDVELEGARTVWLVTTDGGDGNSCDWADWGDLRFETQGNPIWIDELPWSVAEAAWGEVRRRENCVGQPLQIGERRFERGLGTHASSSVAVDAPPGALRLVGQCGPDRGGTDQAEGRITSLAFEVRLVHRQPEPPVERWMRTLQDPEGEPRERRGAALELARDSAGAWRLLSLAQRDALPEELREAVGAELHRHPDLALRALASEHFPRPGEPRDATSIPEILALEGDAARGRSLYLDRQGAQCITCHAFRSGDTLLGGDTGPDLTRIASKYDDAALLDAILNPSAGIAFGYDTWLFEDTDGRVFSGFLLADGPTVVLKDTQGKRVVLEEEHVAVRTKQSISAMPEGVALGLSGQDLRDLLAFLRTPARLERSFGEEVVLFGGGDLSDWTFHSSDPDARLEDVWSVREGVLVCSGNPVGYLRTREPFTNFFLTLEWRFDPQHGPGNSGVLLRQIGDDEVWPRSIEAQLHHQNAGDIWNIGAYPMQADPGRTEGRRSTRMQPSSERPLGEWNRYEILLDGPRLELRVNGVLQNTADWCLEAPGFIGLQSEGARIHFRNVRLRPILR